MAFQSQIPVYQPRGETIAQLLMRQGDIAARGAERSGEIWGRVAENLGNIGAQAYTAHREQKDQQKREMLVDEAFTTYDPANPVETYRRLAVAGGSRFALDTMKALSAGQQLEKAPTPEAAKLWVKGLAAQERLNPGYLYSRRDAIGPQIQKYGEMFGMPVGEIGEDIGQRILAVDDSLSKQTEQTGFTLGPGQVRFGPDGKPLAQGPVEPPKADARVVGRSLVDPTGKVIYRDPEATPQREGKLYEVEVPGPDGTLVKTLKTEAEMRQGVAVAPKSVGNKPVTGAERQSLAYFNRAKESTDGIEDLESRIAQRSFVAQQWNEKVPNVMKSDDQQLYDQRQRAFTEARLRKESGAAIPEAEFANDKRTYWAQPGDSEATIKQKRAARAKVLDGLRYSAGKAYEEYYGEPAPKAGATPSVPEAPQSIGRFKVEVVK